MTIDDALREVSYPHAGFGTLREQTRATEVTAYLRTIPQRVQAKRRRDGLEEFELPDHIGVSWAAVSSLAEGHVLPMFEVLMVMHWLGDLGARGPQMLMPTSPAGPALAPPRPHIGTSDRREVDRAYP